MRLTAALLLCAQAWTTAVNAQEVDASTLAGPETTLAQQTMARFDGTQPSPPPPPAYVRNGANDNGVELVRREDRVVGERVLHGYYSCYGQSYHYPYPTETNFTYCHWIPPQRMVDHRVTSDYRIVDRGRYVASATASGRLYGAFGGLGVGVLAGFLLPVGGWGILALAVLLAVVGGSIGAAVGRSRATAKPDGFREVSHYTRTSPL